MIKKIILNSTVIAAFIVAGILINGCGKKDSVEKQTDKVNNTESKEQNMQNSSDKNAEQVMIKLPTMQCKTCKKNIEKAVNKVPGVINVNVVVDDKIANINFDKSKTDISKIENAITMAGYDANDKKADKDAYNNLDDCCKLPQDQKEGSSH